MNALVRNAMLVVITSLLMSMVALLQANPLGAKEPDPCALATKAEIAEALGVKVSEAKLNSSNPNAGPLCEYIVDKYGTLSFFVRHNNPNDKPDLMMAELNKQKIQTTEIKGIGDRSFYASPGFDMVQLNTFKGTTYILITTMVPNAPEAKVKAAVEKLMQKVLKRI